MNTDRTDHHVTSDDAFNYAVHLGMNKLVPGTDSNAGQPGVVEVQFPYPGLFVYYDEAYATLDTAHQPTAPGPEGGIEDAHGNFGTPMMGVVWVLPPEAAATQQ